MHQLTHQIEGAASATATEAEALFEGSLAGLKRASERTREISRQADEAVYYLQFGDIVRQKTEHIAVTLEEVTAQLAGARSDRESRKRAAGADQVIAIQIGQLELIRSEVDAARRQLQSSFERLAEEAGQLKEILQQVRHPAGFESGVDPLDALKTDLRSLEQLQGEGRDLRSGRRRTALIAAQAAVKLGEHVNEVKAINADVHLRALN